MTLRTFGLFPRFSFGVAPLLALAVPLVAAPPEVLIKWRKAAAITPALVNTTMPSRLGAVYRRSIGRSGWDVAALPEGTDVRAWIERVRNDPAIAHVEPNRRYRAFATVDDRLFPRLHGLTQIGAPSAWDTTHGDASIVIAVLDTGANLTHPDLAPVLWVNTAEIPDNGLDDDGNGVVDDVHGADFVDNDGDPTDDAGHGSHVAGIIAAAGNNQIGVAGVAYGCRIMPIRVLSADGSALTSDFVRAFDYVRALKNRGVDVRIINNSWGGDFPSLAMFEAIAACADAGILSVCAAGNDSHDTDLHPSYPAAYDSPGVLSVAASDSCNLPASFSNFGRRTVHLAAPGTGIYSCWGRGHDYTIASGTSMAAPHVSGAAALLLSRQPSLTLAQLRAVLLRQADSETAWTNRTATGARLNVAQAMNFLNSGQTIPTDDPPNPALTNSSRRIVSRQRTGLPTRDSSYTSPLGSSVTEDGRYVVFLSYDTNLVSGATGGFLQVYLRDTLANTNGRVSQTLTGVAANADCESPIISRDGNYAAFASAASNLVSGDNDNARDVFVWQRSTRTLRLISFDPQNQPFTLDADSPSISDDGSFVAFAADFPLGGGYSIRDIYVWQRANNATEIINFKAPSTFANDWSDAPSLSGDGRFVAYETWADNLVSGDANNAADIHVCDRNTGLTTRISHNAANQQANADCLYPIISGDGRYVAFLSGASNLGQLPESNVEQNYLYDRNTDHLIQISLDAHGEPLDAANLTFDINYDGRFVMLSTDSDQLPPFHGNRFERPFIYDRLTGFQNAVALNDGGFPADDGAYYPAISATGDTVVFSSWANNLVAPDGNNLIDVFQWRRGTQLADLRIRAAGQTDWTGAGIVHPLTPQRVPASAATNGISRAEVQLFNAGLNATAFLLRASVTAGWQLTVQDTNNTDITAAVLAGTQSTASLPPGASYFLRASLVRTDANAESVGVVKFATCTSGSSNDLDAVHAVATSLSPAGLQLGSRNAAGESALLGAFTPAFDSAGQQLAFVSDSDNLIALDENFSDDVFVLDLTSGGLTRASVAADGTPANANSRNVSFARDADLLVFESDADNLVASDSNGAADIFLKNLQTGATELVSRGSSNNTLSRGSENPLLSADGRYVLFESIAPDGVPGDTNGCTDVFLRDRQSGTVECVSLGSSGQFGNADSTALAMTPDARWILFLSHATNLGLTDTNEFPDLYLRDRVLHELHLISSRHGFKTSTGHALSGSLSDDGRFVAFRVDGSDLTPGTNQNLFLLDQETGIRTPIVPEAYGLPTGTILYSAEISPNGATLALVGGSDCGAANTASQVWLAPRTGGPARLLSGLRVGTSGNADSYGPVFSENGERVAFTSASRNLIAESGSEGTQILLDKTAVLFPDAALARTAQGVWRGTSETGISQTTLEQPLTFDVAHDFYLRVTDFSGTGGPVVISAPVGDGTAWSVQYFSESQGGVEVTSPMPGGWTFDPGSNTLDLLLRVRVTIFSADAPASFTIGVSSVEFPALHEEILFSLVQDSDNDGLSDLWERSNFNGSLTTANATSDFDGDGETDLHEYIAGTDPRDPESLLELQLQSLDSSAVFRLISTQTNRFYGLEATPALGTSFTARTSMQRGNGEALVLSDTITVSRTNGFYRARAELP